MEQQIWKHNLEALVRLGLGKPQPSGPRRRTSPRKAIEQNLLDKQGPSLEAQEKNPPYITPPWWQGPNTYIEETADKAISSRCEKRTSVNIYIDGSGINGHVGAAAVCITNGETRTAYMGKENVSTVYIIEL